MGSGAHLHDSGFPNKAPAPKIFNFSVNHLISIDSKLGIVKGKLNISGASALFGKPEPWRCAPENLEAPCGLLARVIGWRRPHEGWREGLRETENKFLNAKKNRFVMEIRKKSGFLFFYPFFGNKIRFLLNRGG